MDLVNSRTAQDKPPAILIADDDPALSLLLQQFLKNQHYLTYLANNGDDALVLCGQHNIDLVLLDAIMPRKDGFVTCELIKQKYPRLPVLMLTGLDDDESVERAFNAGADDYITKPVNWSVFKHRLSKTLDYYGAITLEENSNRKPGLSDQLGARVELASGDTVNVSLQLEEELYQSLAFPTIRQQLIRAINEYQHLKQQHPSILTLSIPMLPCRCESHVYLELLDELVKSHNLEYKELEIRIHEHHLTRPHALQLIHKLSSRPVSIAICHFSFSINSLVFAQNLSCHRILLNLPDIAHVMHDEKAAQWLEQGLAMYRELDIQLVAEGIENDADLKLAARLECDFGSGPLIQQSFKEKT